MPRNDFKIIPGTNDRYMVSSDGVVLSLFHQHGRRITPKVLSLGVAGDGYPIFLMCDGVNRPKTTRVHHAVMLAFIGPSDGRWVLHLNDIKTDNRLENLYYGTQADNIVDAKRNGRLGGKRGPNRKTREKRDSLHLFIDSIGDVGVSDIISMYTGGCRLSEMAAKFGTCVSNIRNLCLNVLKLAPRGKGKHSRCQPRLNGKFS